jgi:hypothetical protein
MQMAQTQSSTQTIAAPAKVNRRYEHLFFSSMAVLILVSVFIGFAQTYYLNAFLRVPAFKAMLPPPLPLIVHVHAVLFSSWIFLLIAQTSLVAAQRLDLHRRLGLIGFGLACCMVPAALAAICAQMVRLQPPSEPPVLPWFQFADLAVFSTLVYLGYRNRRNSAAHKRLVLIATIALLDAAFARWPIYLGNGHNSNFACYALILLLAGYDLLSGRSVHWVTVWGGAFTVVSKFPLGLWLYRYSPGHRVALLMQSAGRHLMH